MNKKIKKLQFRKCLFCKESNYNVLHLHRINPGCEGGRYINNNVICCCANCHAKIHKNEINIIGKYFCTSGRYVVNYVYMGEELWVET